MDRMKDSEKLYGEVLRLDDRYAPAYFGLAMLKLKEERIDEAVQLLQETISINPAHEHARKELAMILLDRGDIEKARFQFEWIVENAVDSSAAHFYLGRIEFSKRNFRKAAEFYRRSYELSGNSHVESLNNLGLSLKAMGDIAAAKEVFVRALDNQPDYQNAHYNLGLLLQPPCSARYRKPTL